MNRLSRAEEYEIRAEELVMPVLSEKGFELVDVEYVKESGNQVLRVYIDKPGGITIDDCEFVNRAFGEVMDEYDFIEDAYILEISSPGLGRKLKKPRDFERSIGQDVDIKLFANITFTEKGKKYEAKDFTGRLDGYDGNNVNIFLGEETKEIPLKDIAIIRLSIDF